MKRLLLILLLAASFDVRAWCQQVQLPAVNTQNLSVMVGPDLVTYLINYSYPPSATSVGLEYMYVMFPSDATGAGDMWLAWYVNDQNDGSRRIGMDHKYGLGKFEVRNHSLSIRMNPGEQFVVSLVNTTGMMQELYFGVLILECYP